MHQMVSNNPLFDDISTPATIICNQQWYKLLSFFARQNIAARGAHMYHLHESSGWKSCA